ncbi:DUF4249 domain-containing protein [Hymenobacter terrenus]|uniref:DUF4249 domain-containing protein n=1 Tax=Hymenobacter terrenus TaxID=1629124 RepID=UPI000619B10A|nr:DUF4249 domain-containing protein [Hymenobacter terrenus]
MKHLHHQSTARPALTRALLLLAGLLALPGCDSLQNDIDVPLPNYPPELVVECYLEDGQVPSLAVTESVPYLSNGQTAPAGSTALALPDGQRVLLPTDVRVTLVLPDGSRRDLPFRPGVNPLTKRLFTHQGGAPIVAQPGATFALEVRDQRGRTVTGTATVPARVLIDSVETKFNDLSGAERKAFMLTNFRDPPGVGDAYRLLLREAKLGKAEIDYTVQDRLNDGQPFTLGSSFRFLPGDTVTSILYHLDPAYYQFRSSVNEAVGANGNPFAQPSAIRSTVQGGLGVFTVLSYDSLQVVVR